MITRLLRFVFVLSLVLFSARRVSADAVQAAPVPTFGYLAPGWLPPLSFPLDLAWAQAGYPERGTVFYSAGAPTSSPAWERFDPRSDLYQAWFGAYVMDHFEFAREWSAPVVTIGDISNSIRRVLALSLVDQDAWLYAYGNPTPSAVVVPHSLVTFPIGNNWFAMRYTLRTHSDVGATTPPFPWTAPFATYASIVDSYAPVTLDVVLVFTYLPSGHLVAVYFSGTEWKTKDGTCHATPLSVILEQLQMLAHTSFPTP
jgi:hypothetical protein